MKSFLFERYGYYPDNLDNNSFDYKGYIFNLTMTDLSEEEIKELDEVSKSLYNLYNEGCIIIKNRSNNYLSFDGEKHYVLWTCKKGNKSIKDLINMHNYFHNNLTLEKIDLNELFNLWEEKFEFIETRVISTLRSDDYDYNMILEGIYFAFGLAENALEYLKVGNYDVAVLDIMMPKMDGISVLKQIRANGNNIPVLILTAKSETDDKVLGLDSGANYYLTKPFDSKELLAAIRAITRTKTEVDSVISFGNINLNRATFELSGPNGSLKLTNKEFQIIEILITNPNHIISTEKFMEKIWGFDTEADISVVWVYISYLRKKLTALDADLLIKASRNAGYSLEKKV